MPTVNVPFQMQLKYIDVWPNDPSKNNGRGYGPSLALRGDINGVDSRVYPKGFCDANIDAMVNAGIIAADTYDYDPAEKYSIKVKNGDITITLSQPAGEKYAKTVFALSEQGTLGSPSAPAVAVAPHRGTPKALPGEFDGFEDEQTAELNAHTGRGTGNTTSPSRGTIVAHNYAATLDWVLKNVVPKLSAADIPVDGAAVNSICATIIIQTSKAA